MGGFGNFLQGMSRVAGDISAGQQQLSQQKLQQQAQQLQMLNYQIALDRMKQQQQQWQAEWPLQQQALQQNIDQGKALADIRQNPTAWATAHGYPTDPASIQSLTASAWGMPTPKQPSLSEEQGALLQKYAATNDALKKALAPGASADDLKAGLSALQDFTASMSTREPRNPDQWTILQQSEERGPDGNYTPAALKAQDELKRLAELNAEKREPREPATEEIQLTPKGPYMKLRQAPEGTPIGAPGTYNPPGTKEVWTIEGPTRAAPRPPSTATQISPADIHFLNLAHTAGGPVFPYNKVGAAAAKDWVQNNMVAASKGDVDSAGKALAQANKDIGAYQTAFGKENVLVHHGWLNESAATQKIHEKATASATQAAIAALNSGQEIPEEIKTYVDNSQTMAANKRYAEILKWRQIAQSGGAPADIGAPDSSDSGTDDDNAQ